jgi:hypothetical protein
MAVRSSLLSLLVMACQSGPSRRDVPQPPTSVSAQRVPSAVTIAPPPPSVPASASLPTARIPSPFEAIGGELPRQLAYTHEAPRAGSPGPLAFRYVNGPSGNSSDSGLRGLSIDQAGVVWRFSERRNSKVFHRVGRVSRADLARMRALAAGAVGKELITYQEGCIDCGSTALLAYGLPGDKGEAVPLASLMPVPSRVDWDPVKPVIGWMEAVAHRALRSERKRPLGLELPIVDGLTESDTGSAEPHGLVFDLEQHITGVTTGFLVDSRGDIYRYFARGRDALSLRRVGNLPATALKRAVAWAESAVIEPRKAEHAQRLCTKLSWVRATDDTQVVLSDDCGERFSGKNADAVIAWLYAIDEQAAPVVEHGWPPLDR